MVLVINSKFVNVSFYAKYTEKKKFGRVLLTKQAFDNINMDFKKENEKYHFS